LKLPSFSNFMIAPVEAAPPTLPGHALPQSLSMPPCRAVDVNFPSSFQTAADNHGEKTPKRQPTTSGHV
jgi:hypothetical protein